MPGRDKTGPQGFGPLTGRRMGFCSENNSVANPQYGMGMRYGFARGFHQGYGRGLGRAFFNNQTNYDRKELIQDQIKNLKTQLNNLEKELENLK